MKQKTVTPRITACIALRKTMRLVQLLCHTAVRRQIVQTNCVESTTKMIGDSLQCLLFSLLWKNSKTTNAITQVQQYLSESNISRTQAPLEYWEYQKHLTVPLQICFKFDVTKTSHSVEKFVNRAFCPQIQIHKHSHCHKHFYFLNKTLAFISCVPTYTCLQKRSVNLAFDRLLVNHMQFSSN